MKAIKTGFFIISVILVPILMNTVWNKIAWEFNLPEFETEFFMAIEILIILIENLKRTIKEV